MKIFPPLRQMIPVSAGLAGLILLISASGPLPVNGLCPVTGQVADASKVVTYQKTVRFCCKACHDNFNNDQNSNVEKVAKFNPKGTVCLMCEKKAGDDHNITFTRTIALSSDKGIPTFNAAPDKYLVFAVSHPRSVNATCPVDGGKVDPHFTADYRKDVWFCCEECRTNFSKGKDAQVAKVAGFDAAKKICLMCDKKFDDDHKETYVRTIGFSSPACVTTFKEAPDTYIVTATKSIADPK